MKEHVTVIPSDKTIIVDGIALPCDFEAHVSGLHALQWHDGKGELEIVSDGMITNKPIVSYTGEVRPYVDTWQATYDEINTPVIPTLEEARETRLSELNDAFEEAAKTAHLISSVGFEIDANETANRDIEGLTLVMSDTDTTLFCDYNNQFREVTKADLETMRREIVANSQRLYRIKWQYRSQIEAATTVEELDAITIRFDKTEEETDEHVQTV